MSIAKVKKIQLLAHTDACMELLAALQEEGLIHIQKTDVEETGLEYPELDVSEQDHWLYKLKQAIDYLSQWQEKSLGQKLSGQKPEVITRARNTILEMDFRSILTEVEGLESQENENVNRIRFLEKEREVLSPLEELKLPMLRILPTVTTQIRIGAVPTTRLPELLALTETEPICADVIHQDKRQAQVWLLLWEKDVERLDAALRELNFNPQHFSEAVLSMAQEQDRVSDILVRISQQVADAQLKVREFQEQGRSLAAKELDNLMRVHDVLFNERQKVCSHGMLGQTGSVYFLEGWIQEENVSRLESRLEPYSDSLEYSLRDPEPKEEFPIALKNRKIWRPFELITKLYGLPQGGTLDPTVSLAPFFFIFVGLTVSEAGYGLLVSLLCLLFLKLAKPKGGLKQFLILMTILGVANVIIGTLVGGWFGFPIRKLLLLDPLEDPVRFLLLALVLGFIQVWFGTFLNFLSQIKSKQAAAAVVQVGWLLLLPGLVGFGVTKLAFTAWIALAGAGCIVLFSSPSRNPAARFFGGLYGLYGISGYLSDILSYSRLLALGLATSVIAMVVNTLCQTALGIPGVGWLIAALIFVGGHLFNLGISFLGGFVHSMRLQFVEFFSKFFQSGGKPFKPFALESKYIDFT